MLTRWSIVKFPSWSISDSSSNSNWHSPNTLWENAWWKLFYTHCIAHRSNGLDWKGENANLRLPRGQALWEQRKSSLDICSVPYHLNVALWPAWSTSNASLKGIQWWVRHIKRGLVLKLLLRLARISFAFSLLPSVTIITMWLRVPHPPPKTHFKLT